MGLFDRLFGVRPTTRAVPPIPPVPPVPPVHPVPLVREAVRLRPIVPIPAERPWRSWIGGHPRLPGSVPWPAGDAGPFRFVAEIDCAALPAGLWLGAGPRRGWLVFFVGVRRGHVAGEVLHVDAPDIDALGPERPSPAPWTRGDVWLRSFLDADADWRREPPSWPVEVLVHRQGEPDVWRSTFTRGQDADAPDPHAGEAIDLARPEYQPHDWESLRALLDVIGKAARRRRESLVRSVGDLVRAQRAPAPNRESFESIRAEVAVAAERLVALDATRPWDAELWVPFAQAAARWRTLHLERDLALGMPLPTLATQLWHFATALVRAVPVYGPYAVERRGPADPAAYERAKALQPRYQAHALAMRDDPRLPPPTVGEGAQTRRNDEGYLAFRAEQPEVWAACADPLRTAFATLVDIETRLRLPKKPDPFHCVATTFSHAWPQSWDDAAALLREWGAVAEREATWAATPPPDRSDKIATAEATLAGVDATRATLADLTAAVADAESRGAAFAWEEWRARVEAVFAGNGHPAFGAPRALAAWNDIRSALAARAYSRNPEASGLPAPVLAYVLARWRYDVQFELPCMGGDTHGYTDLVEPEDDTSQLLLELPESRLFGWFWGDVDLLIFAIPLDALRRGDFTKAVVGVTNGSR